MLVKPLLDELLPKVETRYTLAMLVAKRTRQLVDGAQPLATADTPNLVTMACEEVASERVVCLAGLHQPVVPIRPEIEEARRLAAEQAALAELEAMREANDMALEEELRKEALAEKLLKMSEEGGEASDDQAETAGEEIVAEDAEVIEEDAEAVVEENEDDVQEAAGEANPEAVVSDETEEA